MAEERINNNETARNARNISSVRRKIFCIFLYIETVQGTPFDNARDFLPFFVCQAPTLIEL